MTTTRTLYSFGAFAVIGLLLFAQTFNSARLQAAAPEAPVTAPAETAIVDSPAATALDDLAAWPVAATR